MGDAARYQYYDAVIKNFAPEFGYVRGNVNSGMSIALLIVFTVIVFVLAKLVEYARKSRRQWEDVDKSKLKVWDDSDD